MRLHEIVGLRFAAEQVDSADLRARAWAALRDGAAAYVACVGAFRHEDWVEFSPLERAAALRAVQDVAAGEVGGAPTTLGALPEDEVDDDLGDLLARAEARLGGAR